MTEYTFLSASGSYVTVAATSEAEARERAMQQLWGSRDPYPTWLGARWLGLGLMLKGEA